MERGQKWDANDTGPGPGPGVARARGDARRATRATENARRYQKAIRWKGRSARHPNGGPFGPVLQGTRNNRGGKSLTAHQAALYGRQASGRRCIHHFDGGCATRGYNSDPARIRYDSDVQNQGETRFAGMTLLLEVVLNSSDHVQCIRQGALKRMRCAAAITP